MTANPGARLPGIGSHQSARRGTDVWLTPPAILDALGQFDLDPCAPVECPEWTRATRWWTEADDGLTQPWEGRVFLNPPYADVDPWLARMVEHGSGTALVFARLDTATWFQHVWPHATALLFLRGRLSFYRPPPAGAPSLLGPARPSPSKAGHNSGGPSVLISFGVRDRTILERCELPGSFVDLNGCKPSGAAFQRETTRLSGR